MSKQKHFICETTKQLNCKFVNYKTLKLLNWIFSWEAISTYVKSHPHFTLRESRKIADLRKRNYDNNHRQHFLVSVSAVPLRFRLHRQTVCAPRASPAEPSVPGNLSDYRITSSHVTHWLSQITFVFPALSKTNTPVSFLLTLWIKSTKWRWMCAEESA